MALGTRPVFSRPPWLALEGTILEAQATTTPGRWFPLLGYFPLSITVEGTFVGQVNILVSNAEPPPTDDLVDTMQLGDPGGITGPNKLANLGTCTATQRAGVMVWCPNCGCGAPCVSGSGAYAFCLGANGWVCL